MPAKNAVHVSREFVSQAVLQHTISLDSDGCDGSLLDGRSRGRSSGGREDGGNGESLHDGRV